MDEENKQPEDFVAEVNEEVTEKPEKEE